MRYLSCDEDEVCIETMKYRLARSKDSDKE